MDEQYLSKKDAPQTEPVPGSDLTGFAPYSEEPRPLKHSGPGIASFVIAMVTVAGYIIAFAVAGSLIGPALDETGALGAGAGGGFLFLGMSVLALAALNAIGVVVGIIGLVLRKRRKVFGILGTVFNGLILLAFILLIALAVMSAGALQ